MSFEGPSDDKIEKIIKSYDEIYARAERHTLKKFWHDFPLLKFYREEISRYLNHFPPEKWKKIKQYSSSNLLWDLNGRSFDSLIQIGNKIGNGEAISAEEVEILELAANIEIEEKTLETRKEREIKNEYFGMRLSFLREALERSYAEALRNRRNIAAMGLGMVYLEHQLNIPPKLKLVISDENYKELLGEQIKHQESLKRLFTKERGDEFRDALRTRIKRTEEVKDRLVEEGVHPDIATRRQSIMTQKEIDLQKGWLLEFQEFEDSRQREADEIVATYDDPRDICDWLLDAIEVEKIVKEVTSRDE